jgi:hypothetical protein
MRPLLLKTPQNPGHIVHLKSLITRSETLRPTSGPWVASFSKSELSSKGAHRMTFRN